MAKTIQTIFCILATITMLPACAQEVEVDGTAFPESFVGTQENKIENAEAVSKTFNKLKEGKEQTRILHVGDSHVRGNFFPGFVRKALEVSFGSDAMGYDPIGYNKPSIATETGKPGLVFSSIGINGATTSRFLKPEQLEAIKAQHPDMLILSFGTNEGYDKNYNAERHIGQLQRLISALRETCGEDIEILLTTPPGCFRRGITKDDKIVNSNNGIVAETIANFALENNLALWNMYEIVGGDENACKNWQTAGFIQPDGVHFKQSGYELQGRLLGQAIAKGYNELLNK